MNGENILDISWKTILKISLTLLCFYVLYLIRDILGLIIFAFILSLLTNPAIGFLQKMKFSRLLATALVYILIFGILGGSIYLISLFFIEEISQFTKFFPQYFERITPFLRELGIEIFENLEIFLQNFEKWLIRASGGIFAALDVIFGGIFTTFIIFALTFFFSLEEEWAEKAIRLIFPKKYENTALNLLAKSQQKISAWFGIRILTCLFVGLATFLALKLFKVDYAFSLALLAGTTNIIFVLGPIFAGAVITVLVFFESWLKAIFVLVVFILIQLVEGNFLTPLLSKKLIGLPPALVLIALLIGGRFFGFLGLAFAIPLAGILYDFIREFLKKKKADKDVEI